MPVYVYRNLQTGETFEIAQRITEPALRVHPETGAPVKRLIQPVGIAFKGSGFYVTDSRNGGSKSDGKPAGGSESKTEAKTDAKAEAKSDSKPAESKPDAKPESKPSAKKSDS